MREYAKMTYLELRELDKEKAVLLGCVSPLEVHGPHLPVGTDVFVGKELIRRYAEALTARYDGLEPVLLPPVYGGSDPLPIPGSIEIPPATLGAYLLAVAKGLAGQGFRYLVLADNHGGPRHQLAIEMAARKAWRRYRFHLIDPFGQVFRDMVQHNPELLNKSGLAPGRCGDDPDVHAGANETSLMLACRPELVRESYRVLPASLPPARSGARSALTLLSRLVVALGAREAGRDLLHLGETLAWTGDPHKLPYMGEPAQATAAAGDAMFQCHVDAMLTLVEQAFRGQPPATRPLLWSIRAVAKF